jgi:hypothetical protein
MAPRRWSPRWTACRGWKNDYSKRFRYDSFDNPKLVELRQRYRLDEVVAPGKDEF